MLAMKGSPIARDKVLDAELKQFRPAVSSQSFELMVGVDDGSIPRHHRDTVRQRVEQTPNLLQSIGDDHRYGLPQVPNIASQPALSRLGSELKTTASGDCSSDTA
jgi:hypothetical protein